MQQTESNAQQTAFGAEELVFTKQRSPRVSQLTTKTESVKLRSPTGGPNTASFPTQLVLLGTVLGPQTRSSASLHLHGTTTLLWANSLAGKSLLHFYYYRVSHLEGLPAVSQRSCDLSSLTLGPKESTTLGGTAASCRQQGHGRVQSDSDAEGSILALCKLFRLGLETLNRRLGSCSVGGLPGLRPEWN